MTTRAHLEAPSRYLPAGAQEAEMASVIARVGAASASIRMRVPGCSSRRRGFGARRPRHHAYPRRDGPLSRARFRHAPGHDPTRPEGALVSPRSTAALTPWSCTVARPSIPGRPAPRVEGTVGRRASSSSIPCIALSQRRLMPTPRWMDQANSEDFSWSEALGGTRGVIRSYSSGLVFVIVFVATRALVPTLSCGIVCGTPARSDWFSDGESSRHSQGCSARSASF